MSVKRRMKGARGRPIKKDSQGRNLCRWCEKPVPPPKITFCGPDCVHNWKLRTSGSYLRACVRKRDKEICLLCKLDCKKLRIELRHLYHEDKTAWARRVDELKIPKHRRFRSLWDANHVVPVCEDGGLCDLTNIETLCIWCHRKETNKLLAKRRAKKKATKLLKKTATKKPSKKNVKHITSGHPG